MIVDVRFTPSTVNYKRVLWLCDDKVDMEYINPKCSLRETPWIYYHVSFAFDDIVILRSFKKYFLYFSFDPSLIKWDRAFYKFEAGFRSDYYIDFLEIRKLFYKSIQLYLDNKQDEVLYDELLTPHDF